MPTREPTIWIGSEPNLCNICKRPIKSTFVDGATIHGPWAMMDMECFRIHGVGLGTGKGQLYAKNNEGKWVKIDG